LIGSAARLALLCSCSKTKAVAFVMVSTVYAMENAMYGCDIPEKSVRLRSYQIWEREGRKPGHDKEYWKRAEAELTAECRAALEGRTTRYVMAHPMISKRPLRSISAHTS
jgi:hypothetical protein